MAVILGSTRNDFIIDTAEGNTIFGDPFTEGNFHNFPGNGAILSSGRGGNDYIDGREGVDYIVGDAAIITGTARGGDDYLIGGNGGHFGPEGSFEQLLGDADTELSGSARGGNDILDGGNGVDYMVGDAFFMADNARAGSDLLIGGADTDFLYGDTDGYMLGNSQGGDDLLDGGSGEDELHGDSGWGGGMSGNAQAGNDLLSAGSGNDLLVGDSQAMSGHARAGNDVLVGGAGNDRLYGDADPQMSDLTNVTRGADRFVFTNNSGLDTIYDFDSRDLIDLTGYQGIARFGQVRAHAVQSGDDVVIDLGAAAGHAGGVDVLTLAGVDLADLGRADFLI